MAADPALEERLIKLAREAGNPLAPEAIRAIAATLADTLDALRRAMQTLDALDEAPAMRPVLGDEPGAPPASPRG